MKKSEHINVFAFIIFVLSLLSSLSGVGNKNQALLLKDLTVEIQRLQTEWRVPGVAVGIIKNNEVIFARGFGYRDLEGKKPVTPRTLFRIGSCSKAFTALSIAQIVDKGKISWDQAIVDIVPDFKLKHRWATREVSFKDLLSHRSGIGRHDLLTQGSCFTPGEICQRLQYIPLSSDFRSGFRYSNLNYILAAAVTQSVTGKTWEQLVQENIFSPLEMNNSCFSMEDMKKNNDYAKPYTGDFKNLEGDLIALPFKKCDSFNASGGLISNLDDMMKWIKLHLNKGTVGESNIVSQQNLQRLMTPICGLGYSPTEAITASSYGMGWYIYFYRGHYLVQHTGIVSGYCAVASFMPKENIGVVVLTNLVMHSLPEVINYLVYDRLLGLDPVDYNAHYQTIWKNIASMFKQEGEQIKAKQIKNTRHSQPLSSYPGIYQHPGYGTINITFLENKLYADFNGLVSVPLHHYHYDVWLSAHETDVEFDSLTLHFLMDETGKITGLAVDQGPYMDRVVYVRSSPR